MAIIFPHLVVAYEKTHEENLGTGNIKWQPSNDAQILCRLNKWLDWSATYDFRAMKNPKIGVRMDMKKYGKSNL